nr:immunoglobulin light chain junction region [Macaca mulatta]MOW54850.1 immunoglobulin light chain junction region [Macaca mulatta]MOW55281.1 immunoglobulin light chain junction region [Macaca mulatta]MOY02892.1 immunoglobulin light chain junction region [Macaca mulatta]
CMQSLDFPPFTF